MDPEAGLRWLLIKIPWKEPQPHIRLKYTLPLNFERKKETDTQRLGGNCSMFQPDPHIGLSGSQEICQGKHMLFNVDQPEIICALVPHL